jgi:hypothetical protein
VNNERLYHAARTAERRAARAEKRGDAHAWRRAQRRLAFIDAVLSGR